MNRIFRLSIILAIGLSCILAVLFHSIQPASSRSDRSVIAAKPVDFQRHFQELGIRGSILISNSNGDRVYQYNPQRNQTPFLPASTFKIINSLIALETNVITDEFSILTWDGIPRQIPEWNRDLNMREAFKRSAVWFYQVLARRVGHEQMQQWVTKVGYGNQKIGGKEDIDKFWLTGQLRITPQSQIQFLRRLYKNELPFSTRAISIVKDIAILEQTHEYTLRGKTGWAGFGEKLAPQIGWFIGYLEKGKDAYFFATNIDIRNNKKDPAARIELTRRCLKDLALL